MMNLRYLTSNEPVFPLPGSFELALPAKPRSKAAVKHAMNAECNDREGNERQSWRISLANYSLILEQDAEGHNEMYNVTKALF
ncbi:hypothetical protein SAMN05216316_3118 [Nitrosovibrio sp. Nv6]|nr:hypothetical protein SAMN05216316_3118 [Nitrosovibrio sp. Nv6]